MGPLVVLPGTAATTAPLGSSPQQARTVGLLNLRQSGTWNAARAASGSGTAVPDASVTLMLGVYHEDTVLRPEPYRTRSPHRAER